ncbi:MAG: C1 family peptidase [Myxococcota bacterium]|nr:C1 family peptidase [Myxococcota bacterium]
MTKVEKSMKQAAQTISQETISQLREQFEEDSIARIVQNAVTQTSADDVALNRSTITDNNFSFSILLDQWTATNQKRSGRCWMFAALNLLRVGAMEKMNRKEFEFSQNYTLFWDKFERANFFLEEMIRTADRDTDDRFVAFLLQTPLSDGGQWNMAVDIIRKHGLVPKEVMPETESSSNTRRMNAILTERLRQGARDLRRNIQAKHSVRTVKANILQDIWRILCIHLGTPPQTFLWQWNDKDQHFHRDGILTPQEFAQRYITLPIYDYLCLVHDPRPENPYGRTYTVEGLGNVVGGEKVVYLNVEMELMKEIALRQLQDRTPVWFGCDVGKQMRRDLGIWDCDLFDYSQLYQIPFNLNKGERLHYHQTRMTHAMLFTGVDVLNGKTRRWRVENSWGTDNGRKGFYSMNDSWFDEYMFEIAAPRSMIPANLLTAFDEDPIVLPAWDPMGALARSRD